jgi:hypothetical protein
VLVIDDPDHGFGAVAVGAASTTARLTIGNTGQAPTGGLAVALSDPTRFAIVADTCSQVALAPSATCSVDVRFTPVSVGTATGSLTASASPGGDVATSLGGTGTVIVGVTRSGSGAGTVNSQPAAIACGTTCGAAFSTSSVTLQAQAAAGDVFAGWNGGCSGAGPCQLSLGSANAQVDARFEAMRTLTVSRSGTGTGAITSAPGGIDCGATCGATFVNGTSVQLTAIAAAGSTFTGWTGCSSSTGSSCTVSMTAARSVTASFELAYTLTVAKYGDGTGTVTSSPGMISCGTSCAAASADFAAGSTVTLTATTPPSAVVFRWTGCTTSSGATCTVTMSAAKSVALTLYAHRLSVSFLQMGGATGYVWSTSPSTSLSCTSECSETYATSRLVTLQVSPWTCSRLAYWGNAYCYEATQTGSTCTVDVTGHTDVTVAFEPIPGCS